MGPCTLVRTGEKYNTTGLVLYGERNIFDTPPPRSAQAAPPSVSGLGFSPTSVVVFVQEKEGRGLDLSQGLLITPLIPSGSEQLGSSGS